MAKKNSTKKIAKPKAAKRPEAEEAFLAAEPRRVQPAKYQSFHLQKRLKTYRKPPPGSFRLLFRAFTFLGKDWQLFGGIVFFYLLLELILVQGMSLLSSGTSLNTTKGLLQGSSVAASSGASLFFLLVGNGTGNSSSTAYAFILLILISLVFIWTIRQRYLGVVVRVRDGFYQGVAPLVKFFLVLLTIGVELIPGVIGVIAYSAVVNNGIAVSFVERMLWVVLVCVLVLVSCYYIAATIFALYIVTLNEVTPAQALRMANKLVNGRRIMVMAKILFIPVAMFTMLAIIVVPFLMFYVKIAPTVFFIASAVMVAVLHAYLYGLYRELLNE